MHIIRSLGARGAANSACAMAMAIGAFDGVHLGHRHLLANLRNLADADDIAECAVLTFSPNPKQYFNPNYPQIDSLRQKLDKLAAQPIQRIYLPTFNHQFSQISAEDFIEQLRACKLRLLMVGENFRFGKNQLGDFDLLGAKLAPSGIKVVACPLLRCADGQLISSGRIRDLLASGEFVQAQEFLSTPWQITGPIVRGYKVGRKLGYRTINVLCKHNLPIQGVYAAYALINNQQYQAALSIGHDFMQDGAKYYKVEAYLLDYQGSDQYGQWATIIPQTKIRDQIVFTDLGELSSQISQDVAAVATQLSAQLATRVK